ncbi:hypothetical protein SAMN05444141_1233 [Pseudovibrio denitrificans]|uniref:Uncharacterized protein n=1 Tax=Pseudovibrio denitrificans TaxID=258256 RepID=A0A1I7E0M6_9HYPH|nr:hypothetical protein [Pseudovibrio denitrificans]SFU17466.1 hypothetical protein SAMN05444141_1233 [Pseudovibrio denitrificans]
MKPKDKFEDSIEEIAIILDHLKVFSHKSTNTYDDYLNFFINNYKRIAHATSIAWDFIPEERKQILYDIDNIEEYYSLRKKEGKTDLRYGEIDPKNQKWPLDED